MTPSATKSPADKQGLYARLVRWAFARRTDEGGFPAALRSGARILIIMVQEFSNTHISLRASALTFSIILSMVPMLAMGTAILKGLGSGDQLKTAAYRLIDQMDPELSPAASTGSVEPGTEIDDAAPETVDSGDASLNRHLRNAVETIFNYVENTNFAALGAFGIAGLLIVIIMVLSSVEEAMNAIWHTRRGRSLFRKIMDYLALLVLLPISINIALAGDAILQSPTIMGHISTVIPATWLVQMLLKLLPFVFITLSLMMMYLFFPHVRVKTSAALSGAIFASIFWFIVQRIYVVLQVGVAKYNAIYGSFATVPLFLVWLQLGWTFILLGAVLAHAIQNHNQYSPPGLTETPQHRLQQAFDVLLTVYNNFALARNTTMEQLLAGSPGENEVALSRTAELLADGGLLNRVEENGIAAFAPSRPAEKVTAREIVSLVLGDSRAMLSPGGTLAQRVIQAAEKIIPAADFPDRYLQKTEN